jgi:hypothetical protein
MATIIQYNLVEAHYLIDTLRTDIDRIKAQRDSFEQGIRDFAEAYWWNRENVGKELDQFVYDAVKDYTLE